MKASKIGILSALLASVCCLGPLLLVVLGLGGLGIGAVIGKYHWYFIGGAIVLVIFAWKSYLKKKKTCNLKGCQMENKRITLVTLLLSTVIVSSFVGLNLYTYVVQKDFSEEKTTNEIIDTKSVVLPVKGMTCFTCELSVSSALRKVEGVSEATASAKEGKVRVVYDPARTNIEQLVEAINNTGYKTSLPGGA